MSASAIYTGTVRHRRHRELERAFAYPVSLAYLDLAELPTLLGGRLTARRPGPWRFRRRDYLAPADRPLDTVVRDTVARELGERPTGPVRVLTQLRCFGVAFNPVTLYYCFRPDGESLHAVLAQVTNTPWAERHTYALGPFDSTARVHRATVTKALHVSPFMGMDQRYAITLTPPGETLSLNIDVDGPTGREFDATLGLCREELTARTLSALVRRDPLGPLRTLRRIWTQGITLKLRGVPVHPHPSGGHA